MTAESPLFPDVYSPWLKSRLPGLIEEPLATCSSCAMVKPEGLTRDPGPFDPGLKCCTYFPFIPNFALGALLKEGGEEARLRLRVAMSQGVLLPLGLFASPEREALAKEAGVEGFGRRADLLCPFFDSAASGCSIWRHRPGVCTTYFCKSARGESGFEFWNDVETYLNLFEWTLANEVLWRLGFTEDDLEICEGVMLTDAPDADPGGEREWMVRSAWAEWSGQEESFLLNCYERALQVSPNELTELLGDETIELEKSLRTGST